VNRESGSLKAYRIHLSSEFFLCHSKTKTRRRQKPIGALNSARIGEEVKLKNFKNFFSTIGEVWKELKI
jgi:hypothetical protein